VYTDGCKWPYGSPRASGENSARATSISKSNRALEEGTPESPRLRLVPSARGALGLGDCMIVDSSLYARYGRALGLWKTDRQRTGAAARCAYATHLPATLYPGESKIRGPHLLYKTLMGTSPNHACARRILEQTDLLDSHRSVVMTSALATWPKPNTHTFLNVLRVIMLFSSAPIRWAQRVRSDDVKLFLMFMRRFFLAEPAEQGKVG